MTDDHVAKILAHMQEAIKRADTSLDAAVRVIDIIMPTDDFSRLTALDDSAVQAELWLTRALAYATVLDILDKRDHALLAKATATHVALEEVAVERSRLRDRISKRKGGIL